VAHRGASADAPENTLAALRLGYAQGAEYAECDVRLTRDGEVVLMHDEELRRTTGATGRVDEFTLAELRGLDAGAWRGDHWRGEKIPTLGEALALVASPGGGMERRRLLIEIKSGPETVSAISAALAASAARGCDACDAEALVLMSFDAEVTAEARRVLPEIERHWLTEERAPVAALCAKALGAGCSALNLDRSLPIDAGFVATAHAAGLGVFVWTVDNVSEARRLVVAGVDGLTTNRPGALRGELQRPAGGA
jgi:glycerophosphoryl diester phosphodiesterase